MDHITKEELINRVGDLKVLPFVARKALEILNDENCSIDALSNIIEKDQTIAARVLKISNSALYGLRQNVGNIQQAVMILGFKTIRSIILTATTRSLYKKFGITEKMMWDHSVGAGIASKILSVGLGSEVEDIAFVGGLMHDLGKVMMNNETPDLYNQVMMDMYNEGLDSIQAEKDVYGYDHTEIGSSVLERWKFSPVIVKILKLHHQDSTGIKSPYGDATAKNVACVNLADNVCKVLGIGYRQPDTSIVLHELPSAKLLNMEQNKMESLANQINDTYSSEKSVFE
jgi:putative nucleotidyltransferase with HDIG domain